MIQIIKFWITVIITSMLFGSILTLLVLTNKYNFLQYITANSLLQTFLIIFFLYIKYIHYFINNMGFSFWGFLMSILKQIFLILAISKFIYIVNNQNYITIEDDKSLQYICAVLIFLIMTSFFWIKVQKDGFKKGLLNAFLLILSFYLLRLNLIFIIPMVLPAILAQQAIEILTSKVNLIRYIFEDIINFKFVSEIQFNFLDILQLFLPSPRVLDSHITNVEWSNHYRSRQFINPERTISLDDLDEKPYLLGSMIYNPDHANLFQKMKLNSEELKGLLFIFDKWGFTENIVTLVGSSPQVLPFPYRSVLPDFYGYPNGTAFDIPFPYSKDFSVPLYNFRGRFRYVEDIIQSSNIDVINVKEYLLISINDPDRGVWPESYSVTAYAPMNYAKPSHVNDWSLNDLIYVKIDEEHFVKYNPFSYTDDMMNKNICLKTPDGEMVETIMKTPKLYKPFEAATNIRNSQLYRCGVNSNLLYGIVKSNTLSKISWNDVNWTSGSMLNRQDDDS